MIFFIVVVIFSCVENNVSQLKIENMGTWKFTNPNVVAKLSYDAKQIAVIDQGQLILINTLAFKNQITFTNDLAITNIYFTKDNKFVMIKDSIGLAIRDRYDLTLINRIVFDSLKHLDGFRNIEAITDTSVFAIIENFESPVYRRRIDRFSLSRIEVYDVVHRKAICKISDSSDRIVSVMANYENEKLITLSNNNQIKIWDFNMNKPEFVIIEKFSSIHRPIISRDGQFIAYFDINNFVTIWDILSKTKVSRFSFQTPVIYTMNDKNILFTVTQGGIGIYQKNPLKKIDNIEFMNMSGDGNFYLQYSKGEIELWKVSDSF